MTTNQVQSRAALARLLVERLIESQMREFTWMWELVEQTRMLTKEQLIDMVLSRTIPEPLMSRFILPKISVQYGNH